MRELERVLLLRDPLRLPAPQPDPVAIALTVPYVVTTLTANHDTPELAEAIAALEAMAAAAVR